MVEKKSGVKKSWEKKIKKVEKKVGVKHPHDRCYATLLSNFRKLPLSSCLA